MGRVKQCKRGYRECDGQTVRHCSPLESDLYLVIHECTSPYSCIDLPELEFPICSMTTSPYPRCPTDTVTFECDGTLMYGCRYGYRIADARCRSCVAGSSSISTPTAECSGRLEGPCVTDADCLEGLRCVERFGVNVCTIECDCDVGISPCSTCAPYGSDAWCLDGWCVFFWF